MKRTLMIIALVAVLALTCGAGGGAATQAHRATQATPHNPPAAGRHAVTVASGNYVLTAWDELGMHCMDGKDYSVFAVLPPYNTIHAQLMKRGEPPSQVTSGVTVTYTAVADAKGSINTRSATKTNFWKYVQTLFLTKPNPDFGLTGYKVQNNTPQNMTYNATSGYWEATGIPTVPYDDAGQTAYYSMIKVVAKDSKGVVLATAKIPLAVSDEMTCKNCHASGADAAAEPASGWVWNPNPAKDTKFNILKKHDDRWDIKPYLTQLSQNGWNYKNTLYDTAKGGTPVLCAACHSDNALGLAGITGINSLTQDMHTLHGPQINPATGISLDNATDNLTGCYLCHPGPNTQCARGAMNTQKCTDCHSNLTAVGASTRTGWMTLPACQMCHNNSTRFTSAYDSNGQWRTTTDLTFATNDNVPSAGFNLYRFSTGHGSVYCSGCHSSQHAEWPSLQANDNVLPSALQGYAAKVTECSVCHTAVTTTQTGGPHGVHTLGQNWVDAHPDYASDGKYTACAYCHGSDYKGSFLSLSKVKRTFKVDDGKTKTFAAGHQFSCYDCHNGPQP